MLCTVSPAFTTYFSVIAMIWAESRAGQEKRTRQTPQMKDISLGVFTDWLLNAFVGKIT